MIARAFPQEVIQRLEPFAGGLINTNIKVYFDSAHPPVVLRIYRDGSNVSLKEMAIHKLVESDVPVARIIHAVPEGIDGSGAFAILEFVEGITFQQLKRTGNAKAIKQAARSVGKTLAAIGRFHFSSRGRLVVDQEQLRVGEPFITGPDQIPRVLDGFLDSPKCEQRTGTELIRRLHEFVWNWADRLPDLDEQSSLVHNDFGNKNILINEFGGRWKVAAVLDWEICFSGSPLLDVGHFLRYERWDAPVREPHFSNSFVEHGGHLPENWKEIVRVIDLTALAQCLTIDDLPINVEEELLGLVRQTLIQLAG